jgi:hypothetical protein
MLMIDYLSIKIYVLKIYEVETIVCIYMKVIELNDFLYTKYSKFN